MSIEEIPSDVVALLRERVPRLDRLEVLLLLRSDAGKRWTAPAVAAQLVVPEARVRDALEALRMAELVVSDEDATEREFLYRPATPSLEAAVRSLAQIYAARPADVLRVLNDHALQRVRTAASQAFSEALMRRGRRP